MIDDWDRGPVPGEGQGATWKIWGRMRTLGLSMDTRRLNITITRAKVKLVMVGDRQTLLMDFEPFKKEIVKLSQTILMNI